MQLNDEQRLFTPPWQQRRFRKHYPPRHHFVSLIFLDFFPSTNPSQDPQGLKQYRWGESQRPTAWPGVDADGDAVGDVVARQAGGPDRLAGGGGVSHPYPLG